VLRPLQQIFAPADYPDLLVGLGAPDDAAVYRLDDRRALIVTTDFFPPVVDDPYDYGAIAAANAMSDVFAMGGEVLFALNLAAFPGNLETDILSEILRGGAEKVREAGAAIAGGHTIKDAEPKYGLAVIGLAAPGQICSKAGARPGDVLVLSKALGTGVVTTALKRGEASADDVAAAVAGMSRQKRVASKAAFRGGCHPMH
jgi:selenide,water dikinase